MSFPPRLMTTRICSEIVFSCGEAMGHSLSYLNDRNHSYLEQFCAIAATALLGVVAVMARSNGHTYVAWSGIVILSLAVLRSPFLLLSLARHGYHRLEQGFNPWRYVILSFPIILYFFGPPISPAKSGDVVLHAGQDRIHANVLDLENWTKDEAKREWSEGRTGVVEGFLTGKGRTLMLWDPKVEKFHVTVISEQELPDFHTALVQVTGQIQYRKWKDLNIHHVVLKVRSQDDIRIIRPFPDP
jgi:hypothetical protein